MNLPVLLDPDSLIELRDDIDGVIKSCQKINEIGNDKMDRVKELIGDENAQKVMDILFEELKL